MPLSGHTAFPLSVILRLDHVMFKTKRSEILGFVGIRLPAKDTPGTHALRQIRLNRSYRWSGRCSALRLRRFCISPMSIGTFPYVLNRLPLHGHSRQTAALGSPRLSPGSSLLWRHRRSSKASMAHSLYHPSTNLQRSCLLTPTAWFRRRVPIDPIRSLRNPDHPGGNPGQSPAPAHPVCFVWPAMQVRSTMVAIPVPCGATGQPV
jgi:hypothetical protein